jgi:ankyrin repeat protein
VAEIHNAIDDDGDLPLHIAAESGNSDVVEWILNKAEMNTVVNSLNGNDLTALFLVCLKGYVGTDGVASRTEKVKTKRLEAVKLLVEKGADIN